MKSRRGARRELSMSAARCDAMNELTYTIGPGRLDELAFLPAVELAAARLLTGHAPESILSVATSNDDLAGACRDGRRWVARAGSPPALRSVVDDEARRGLDPEQRVIMRYAVDSRVQPGMSVRPARVDDRPRLLDLWERSVRATHDFLAEDDVETLKPLVAAELASDAFAWSVLEVDGPPIGFLGFANDSIEALFIDPERRGQGAGSVLVEHAQRLARGTLGVDVNEQNDAARRFYERCGFAVVGRSPTDSDGRPFPILHMKGVR
jgi:putative acetyltransferase